MSLEGLGNQIERGVREIQLIEQSVQTLHLIQRGLELQGWVEVVAEPGIEEFERGLLGAYLVGLRKLEEFAEDLFLLFFGG